MAHSDLYLTKENGIEIKIPCQYAQKLKHFQLDGIRFLHKQYSLNQGAILNDDSGLGKTIQVVLYIAAIKFAIPSTKTLIFCSKTQLDNWLFHFKVWSDLSVTQFCQEFKKSDVVVSPLDNSNTLLKCGWQIIVIDDLEPNDVLRQLHTVKCKYKIWLRSRNLLNDLKSLYKILCWLIPGMNFPYSLFNDKFSTYGFNVMEAWRKRQLLNSYCKPFLLRRTQCAVEQEIPLHELKDYERMLKTCNKDQYLVSSCESMCRMTGKCGKCVHSSVARDSMYKNNEYYDIYKNSKRKDITGLKVKKSKKQKSECTQNINNETSDINMTNQVNTKKIEDNEVSNNSKDKELTINKDLYNSEVFINNHDSNDRTIHNNSSEICNHLQSCTEEQNCLSKITQCEGTSPFMLLNKILFHSSAR